MAIVGTVEAECTACGKKQSCELVQSVNTRTNPAAKERLMKGELNVLVCSCGKRTQLLANVLFHDPDADYLCHVCPGGDEAVQKAIESFRASGATGRQRIVPSLNALVEKLKLLDAGLEDWAIEMTKVLLLASVPSPDLDRVLLFDSADTEHLHWVLFDGNALRPVASPRGAYERIAEKKDYAPPADELQIDRAWAVETVRKLIWNTN